MVVFVEVMDWGAVIIFLSMGQRLLRGMSEVSNMIFILKASIYNILSMDTTVLKRAIVVMSINRQIVVNFNVVFVDHMSEMYIRMSNSNNVIKFLQPKSHKKVSTTRVIN